MSTGSWLLLAAIACWIWYASTSEGKARSQAKYEQAKAKHAQDEALRAARLGVPQIACPTCGKHTVERMTIGARAASGVAGGLLFSKGARSQFRCRACRYMW